VQTPSSARTESFQQRIVDLAMKHRLPAIYSAREFVDAGGLTSYGVSYPDLYRRAATYDCDTGAATNH
jgi:putative tryptophan/tyrosine transport system substrate-binding protein